MYCLLAPRVWRTVRFTEGFQSDGADVMFAPSEAAADVSS